MEFKNKTELFNWIWNNRSHESELSGEPLLPKGHPQWHWQFMHVLPASYKAYKLKEFNVILGTVKEHETQESNPKFRAKYDELKKRYYKEIYNKTF